MKFDYKIEIVAHLNELKVNLSISDFKSQKLKISLPAWIPGSYKIRDFSKYLVNLKLKKGKNLEQLNKNTYLIHCQKSQTKIELEYKIYSFESSVRDTIVNLEYSLLNFATFCFYPTEYLHQADQEYQVQIKQAKEYKNYDFATSLIGKKQGNQFKFKLSSFDELIDNPILIAPVKKLSFTHNNIKHSIAIAGYEEFMDTQRLKNDIKKVVESANDIFQTNLTKNYHFLLILSYDDYGGLEHCDNTVLMSSKFNMPYKNGNEETKKYQTLLSLFAHEYFHLWLVKRITNAQIEPFDYSQENYTELLWFFEGITSFFDDYLIYHSKLSNLENYLAVIQGAINRLLGSEGYLNQTLEQSSFNAWIKLYQADAMSHNYMISYYNKGMLLAFYLDMLLYQHSQSFGLTELLRKIWALQKKSKIAVDKNLIIKQLSLIAPKIDWQAILKLWLEDLSNDFFAQLQSLMVKTGFKVSKKLSNKRELHFTYSRHDPVGVKIKSIHNRSVLRNIGLKVGDVIVGLNDYVLNYDNFTMILNTLNDIEKVTLHYIRNFILYKVEITLRFEKMVSYQVKANDKMKLNNYLLKSLND